MDLNHSASNRVQLQAERTVVVTVAALCMELGHVSPGARAGKTTRFSLRQDPLPLPRLSAT